LYVLCYCVLCVVVSCYCVAPFLVFVGHVVGFMWHIMWHVMWCIMWYGISHGLLHGMSHGCIQLVLCFVYYAHIMPALYVLACHPTSHS